MNNAKEAIRSVGITLANFSKSGPNSPSHLEEIETQILDVALSLGTTPEVATENYKTICKDLLDKVIKVRGMPTRAVASVGGEISHSDLVSSSGEQVAQSFDNVLPKIIDRYNWCIENYKRQSKLYFDEQLSEFRDVLVEFLGQRQTGGAKDKLTTSKIAEIKRELRYLTTWPQSFYVYKATSFSTEVQHIFACAGGAVAVIWHYSPLDEQGEYHKTYSHKDRDGRVYVLPGSWAINKGLMTAEPKDHIDDNDKPQQQIGCMCNYQYLYTLRQLPKNMVTGR